MGILSFFAGENRNSDPVDRDAPGPERGSAQGPETGSSATPEATPSVGPESEPGAGIADFEPLASEGESRGRASPQPEVQEPDWWRSARGAPPSTPDGFDSFGPEPGAWNLGALLEPPRPSGPQIEVGPADPRKTLELKPKIVDALSTVFDPEIPVDIYELGLIYEIVIDAQALVLVRMTLTSPACPSAQQLPSEVQYKVKAVPGVADAAVEVVWEPPWTKDMMSDAAKLSLGIW